MAIVNRSLDATQQTVCLQQAYNGGVATGVTLHAMVIPSAATLKKVSLEAAGLSGAPAYALRIQRFIVGAGATVIDPTGAATLAPSELGTSGIKSFSLLASGNTLLNLLPGDLLTLTSSGSNTAVKSAVVAAVIQYTQDIKSTLGV